MQPDREHKWHSPSGIHPNAAKSATGIAAAAGTVSREREGENGGPHGPLSAARGYTVERPPGCAGEWFALTLETGIACVGGRSSPMHGVRMGVRGRFVALRAGHSYTSEC